MDDEKDIVSVYLLQDKESAKQILIKIIAIYLVNLQSGKYGVPTLNDLQTAGLLHGFIEETEDA